MTSARCHALTASYHRNCHRRKTTWETQGRTWNSCSRCPLSVSKENSSSEGAIAGTSGEDILLPLMLVRWSTVCWTSVGGLMTFHKERVVVTYNCSCSHRTEAVMEKVGEEVHGGGDAAEEAAAAAAIVAYNWEEGCPN